MIEDTKQLMTPEEATENLFGEQYVEWMLNTAVRTVRAWPEMESMRTATPKIEKIRKFLIQRFIAAEAFLGGKEGDPGFLGFAIGNLSEVSDPLAESALEELEKLRDKVSRSSSGERESWVKLLKAVGVTADEIQRAEPKEPARTYIAELSDVYSNSDWQTAIGSFEAQLQCMKPENEALLALIRNNTGLPEAQVEAMLPKAEQA
ncbi:MAG: hypothetical protein ACM3NH_01010, partial [Candidatus Saccharibacteria bacterium]